MSDPHTRAVFAAHWRTVPNHDLGDVRIVADTPHGEAGVVDLTYSAEIAEHIADVHNRWLARQNMGVPVATGFITLVDVSAPPMWRTLCRRLGGRSPGGVGR